MNFETLEVFPTRIRVASILRKAILSGEFSAGQELSLTETAAQLGVSRTPVREAFQVLAGEGLIELRMNKSAVVRLIDVDYIRDHYDMRRLLESEAIFRAAKNKMDTSALQKEQDKIARLGRDGLDSEMYQDYNQLLHCSIWKASGSPKLYSFLSSLWNGSSFGKSVSELDHQLISIEEHGRMLGFIRENDAESAKKEMEHHITRSMENILSSYTFEKQPR